ncbi:UDP-glycosyltransferase UGT5-like isoform X47 [Planococcus citri]|uniref:UDP-glycosyltransferase UGT5-like isoform X47 n=1 Tax=Planococcus citri TaxID=170843 RepID=UPI0031F9A527
MLVISLLISLFGSCRAYKILGLFPYPGRSHFTVVDTLLVELSKRGHELTVYTCFPKNYSLPNYKDIDISDCFPSVPYGDILKNAEDLSSAFSDIRDLLTLIPSYEKISSCQPIVELRNTGEKYDLMITQTLITDFFTLFAYKLNIPFIGFFPDPPYQWMATRMGMPYNPSYMPHLGSGFTPEMNFWQRVMNFLVEIDTYFMYNVYSYERGNEMAKKFFGSVPKLQDWVKNTSLIFFYLHFSFYRSRPIVPNTVDVHGLHIKQSNPLEKNIEKFINESKHGVVYFCMGSLLRGETFPPEKREAFLYAFSKIPQRVLWKWEGDVLPGKSDNIMISKWMPQRDILAHPNVKLFISHGGLLGTSEAVYEGVPVLGIPIFGDQRTNIKSLEANGAGELLDYNEISKEVVLEKIQRLLNDPKYKENAKLLSDRYRDRPMSPLDTAVYWTEYVIRHKGAPHLRTAAADMPWYQYLLLDVIAFIVAVLVAGLLIIYYTTKFILRAIYGLICGGGAKKGSSKSDKKKRN